MTDKLEALSQPVGYFIEWQDAETGEKEWCECSKQNGAPLYSQEYVTALLAALEEKDKQIAHQKICLDNEIKSNAWAFNRIRELEQRLQQPNKEGKELFAEISSECVVDNDNFVGYLVKDESMGNLERLLTGSLSLPIKLTLPTTRYWHGPLGTYEKSDVIACINAAAKSSNVIIKVEGE
ncbi:hypothetical protein [Serratia sp. N21D137]|uniref:hypothetical protein n=1 Tax=Serratia sp. N21D137 TaxID=3397495 RepID=UPI0039E06998